MRQKSVFAIKDRFHPGINGTETPEVRSDNPAFETEDDFFSWVRQHGGDAEVYEVPSNTELRPQADSEAG